MVDQIYPYGVKRIITALERSPIRKNRNRNRTTPFSEHLDRSIQTLLFIHFPASFSNSLVLYFPSSLLHIHSIALVRAVLFCAVLTGRSRRFCHHLLWTARKVVWPKATLPILLFSLRFILYQILNLFSYRFYIVSPHSHPHSFPRICFSLQSHL